MWTNKVCTLCHFQSNCSAHVVVTMAIYAVIRNFNFSIKANHSWACWTIKGLKVLYLFLAAPKSVQTINRLASSSLNNKVKVYFIWHLHHTSSLSVSSYPLASIRAHSDTHATVIHSERLLLPKGKISPASHPWKCTLDMDSRNNQGLFLSVRPRSPWHDSSWTLM